MFYKIEKINILENKKLEIKFNTGEIKIYSLKEYIKKLKKIIKKKEFGKVKIDKKGYGITWPSGIELSSNEIWKNGKKQI